VLKQRALRRSGRHTVSGDAQAEEILRCARKVILEHGAGGFSVRKVAQAAGISIGHLQHYFATRADLLRAVLVDMEQRFHDHYGRSIATIDDPLKRLDACAAYLLGESTGKSATPILREFWSLAARDEIVAEAMNDFYSGFRRFTTRIVQEADPRVDAATASQVSATLIATLSGAFIFLDDRNEDDQRQALRDYLQSIPAQLLSGIRSQPAAASNG